MATYLAQVGRTTAAGSMSHLSRAKMMMKLHQAKNNVKRTACLS